MAVYPFLFCKIEFLLEHRHTHHLGAVWAPYARWPSCGGGEDVRGWGGCWAAPPPQADVSGLRGRGGRPSQNGCLPAKCSRGLDVVHLVVGAGGPTLTEGCAKTSQEAPEGLPGGSSGPQPPADRPGWGGCGHGPRRGESRASGEGTWSRGPQSAQERTRFPALGQVAAGGRPREEAASGWKGACRQPARASAPTCVPRAL